jgi:AcrR family transcriptional regulator
MQSSPETQTFTEKARRAQIVKAAIDTVNELGYPRASISAIARRAGVAKSAIVYYFATKDALLLHVVDHIFTKLDETLTHAVSPHTEPERRLRAYLEAYLGHVDTHRAEIAAGVEIVVSHRRADGVPLYLTGTEEDSAMLRRILADGMERGVFRPVPLRIAVNVVEALLDVATTELQRDLAADLTELVPELVRVVFRGLAPAR